jgi:hypothetical protein
LFYQERIPSLKINMNELEERMNFYKQRLALIDELQAIGFGPKELKALWHTIIETSDANNISRESAVKKKKAIMTT